FGLIPQWVTLEPRVFGWMDRLCEDYCGGIWNLYTLNNGGAFMAPEPDDDGKRLVRTVLIFTESSDQLSRATDRVP
ncbi:antirestriction protein, partial [Escherichia coli]|uniref:antirestriction protein n=1 Tax=Escherichia coli TaxID=562 RepID=UPI0040687A7B